ncbi:hypothetical protein ACEN2I_01635 [Flavobacterium sp. W22_SRS_FK3]|uniref:hypothetical protein n=1 Tax=Flavobacterium sp. W22_SRS_FK3 TaxID=3240275 RepID=UPI003F91F9E1
MKKSIYLLFVFVSFVTQAQETDIRTNKIEHYTFDKKSKNWKSESIKNKINFIKLIKIENKIKMVYFVSPKPSYTENYLVNKEKTKSKTILEFDLELYGEESNLIIDYNSKIITHFYTDEDDDKLKVKDVYAIESVEEIED